MGTISHHIGVIPCSPHRSDPL